MNVAELIEQAVSGLGYELVDVETSPRGRLLRIFIDAEQGINVDDCVAVSNHLTRLFTVENVDYDRLEVSSPGLDRPLKKAADFIRFTGQEAQLRLRIPLNNQRSFSGRLAGVSDGRLTMEIKGVAHEFELSQIERARLVPDFERKQELKR
ncbi:ribosome maturation factor RimP [Methyloversatilis sp.]|uniref:ribosome maturation factor RimP n=1 Tax=Methyloversatilis sp. TaxID=2569862 RepID=UPI0027347005|nr:ribosome maturation factor RimP [Methyloversatilis sp.]MDP2868981.1 ribosome maturation factor RimP [Methyloversatilis sp.]MDP3287466.1 ribosome maturation factor RimP [Methyloversatilis sp.]MDP3455208.1 ribosome maturation factor RimP [Methyloversatilis sp.]MDP3579543.1 ribosome maturation factor RimP [Methyloversatilis sp.]